MNYLIQNGKIRSQCINVPKGLPELLSDITREVLRCQPTTECLCQFIIDYLHSVIVTREKARMAKMIIDRALRTVDEVISDMCICDIDKSKAEYMCSAMEECFRRFLNQRRCETGKKVELVKFNEIDIFDELIRKCKFSDDELKITRPIIEAAYQKFVDAYMSAQENTDGTEALYQYFRDRELKKIEDQLKEDAATTIQANFRGFLVRRTLFAMKEVEKPAEHVSENSADLEEMDKAARKIQQFFRRHQPSLHRNVSQPVDVCKPESNVSLTARKPDSFDLMRAEMAEHLPQPEDPKNQELEAEIIEMTQPIQSEEMPSQEESQTVAEESPAPAE